MRAYTYVMQNISDKLRSSLLDRPESLREISRLAEIDVAQLSRFANDQPGGKLGQDSIDRLCDYLGLDLVARKRRRGV
jgi:hypothetical protein